MSVIDRKRARLPAIAKILIIGDASANGFCFGTRSPSSALVDNGCHRAELGLAFPGIHSRRRESGSRLTAAIPAALAWVSFSGSVPMVPIRARFRTAE